MKKTSQPRKPRKVRKPPEEIIDYDALWKDFIAAFIAETTQATMPELWAAVDWTVPAVFLEQEFINSLRGKFKIKDKRKYTDKLARLRLLTGEDCYILFHIEVQNELETLFSRRMFTYKSLAFLRYDTERFTALALFIGKAPTAEHKVYEHEEFGTKTTYAYNSYTVAEQDEAALETSGSLFDLGVLAAKLTLDTEGDEARRFKFKRRLFELAAKRGNVPIDKLHKLLTFVSEYMDLSPSLENEFQAVTPYFESFKSDTKMYTTWRSRIMADNWYKHATGKSFTEKEAEFTEKEAEFTEKEAEFTEKEAEFTEKEAEFRRKEAEFLKIEAEKEKSVLSVRSKTDFSVEKIADLLGYDLAFVESVLASKKP